MWNFAMQHGRNVFSTANVKIDGVLSLIQDSCAMLDSNFLTFSISL